MDSIRLNIYSAIGPQTLLNVLLCNIASYFEEMPNGNNTDSHFMYLTTWLLMYFPITLSGIYHQWLYKLPTLATWINADQWCNWSFLNNLWLSYFWWLYIAVFLGSRVGRKLPLKVTWIHLFILLISASHSDFYLDAWCCCRCKWYNELGFPD